MMMIIIQIVLISLKKNNYTNQIQSISEHYIYTLYQHQKSNPTDLSTCAIAITWRGIFQLVYICSVSSHIQHAHIYNSRATKNRLIGADNRSQHERLHVWQKFML